LFEIRKNEETILQMDIFQAPGLQNSFDNTCRQQKLCNDDNALNECASFLFGNFYQINNKVRNELDW
jgi:hypothetical protein